MTTRIPGWTLLLIFLGFHNQMFDSPCSDGTSTITFKVFMTIILHIFYNFVKFVLWNIFFRCKCIRSLLQGFINIGYNKLVSCPKTSTSSHIVINNRNLNVFSVAYHLYLIGSLLQPQIRQGYWDVFFSPNDCNIFVRSISITKYYLVFSFLIKRFNRTIIRHCRCLNDVYLFL